MRAHDTYMINSRLYKCYKAYEDDIEFKTPKSRKNGKQRMSKNYFSKRTVENVGLHKPLFYKIKTTHE